MEKAIQTNESGAEESASAATEMTAQAEQMKVRVAELIRMVGGFGRNAAAAPVTPARISR